MLYSHHLYLGSSKIFPSLQTIDLLPVIMGLSILDISYTGIIPYIALCVWLLSLSARFWRFIHIVACIDTSFLLWLNVFHCMYIPHFVYDRDFNCFHLLAIVNSAPVNICVYVIVWLPVLSSFRY